jgi:hypothetical protein
MPPIATSVVDEADIPLVAAWIEQLVPAAAPDAGPRDAADRGDAGAEQRESDASPSPTDAGDDAVSTSSDDAPSSDAASDAPSDALDAPSDALDGGAPEVAPDS